MPRSERVTFSGGSFLPLTGSEDEVPPCVTFGSENVTFCGLLGLRRSCDGGVCCFIATYQTRGLCKTVYRTFCKPFCKRCAAGLCAPWDKGFRELTEKEL